MSLYLIRCSLRWENAHTDKYCQILATATKHIDSSCSLYTVTQCEKNAREGVLSRGIQASHVEESPAMKPSPCQKDDRQPATHRPKKTDTTGPVHRVQRSNSGDRSRVVKLCVHFLTCSTLTVMMPLCLLERMRSSSAGVSCRSWPHRFTTL
jgi:hypothetical protein